jgi:hypothetical protein
MYYVGEIIDRTFANWSEIIGATDNSLWATSATIETKPATDSDTNTSNPTPAEIPAWEPGDTNEWNESAAKQSDEMPTTESNEWDTSTAEQSDSNPISETLQNITDTAKQVIDEINPFADREPDRDS